MSDRRSLAPTVSSPKWVVRRMLELAGLRAGEMVYDLGSGDSRIPIMAAEEFGARGVGVELKEGLVEEARERVKSMGLEGRVEFIHDDVFEVDLSQADVVTMYLNTRSNEELRPKLEEELKTGARVVTHNYAVRKWGFREKTILKQGYRRRSIYLYTWPGKMDKEG